MADVIASSIMGEAKRKAATRPELEKLTADLTDAGKIIEAGWLGFVVACEIGNAPELQLKEMRMAFFAGAQHLFASMMTILEPGEEPTDKDLARIDLIDKELRHFGEQFIIHNVPTEGRA